MHNIEKTILYIYVKLGKRDNKNIKTVENCFIFVDLADFDFFFT